MIRNLSNKNKQFQQKKATKNKHRIICFLFQGKRLAIIIPCLSLNSLHIHQILLKTHLSVENENLKEGIQE